MVCIYKFCDSPGFSLSEITKFSSHQVSQEVFIGLMTKLYVLSRLI